MLVWDFSGDRPKWVTLSTDGQKGHSRIVFTLTEFCGGTKLISTSMDRNVVLWDIKAEQLSSAGSAEKEVVNKKDKADRSEIELEEHLPGENIHIYIIYKYILYTYKDIHIYVCAFIDIYVYNIFKHV